MTPEALHNSYTLNLTQTQHNPTKYQGLGIKNLVALLEISYQSL